MQRDAWLDVVLGLDGVPEDGPELPRGCVPYLPCPVDALLRAVEHADVQASDVFVDVGAGLGRTAVLVHLITGAATIGLEIQPALVQAARDVARHLGVSRASFVEGDAVRLTGCILTGSVFFFYCPFSGERLERVLDHLERIARTRTIRICCVDLPLPPRPWLTVVSKSDDLAVYRSKFPGAALSPDALARSLAQRGAGLIDRSAASGAVAVGELMPRSKKDIGKGHLESLIHDALAEDPRLHVLGLEVLVVEGHVHLLGQVPSPELRTIAQTVVEEVCEDMPVENRLQVIEPAHESRSEQIR